jgi:hypothetical protein
MELTQEQQQLHIVPLGLFSFPLIDRGSDGAAALYDAPPPRLLT